MFLQIAKFPYFLWLRNSPLCMLCVCVCVCVSIHLLMDTGYGYEASLCPGFPQGVLTAPWWEVRLELEELELEPSVSQDHLLCSVTVTTLLGSGLDHKVLKHKP